MMKWTYIRKQTEQILLFCLWNCMYMRIKLFKIADACGCSSGYIIFLKWLLALVRVFIPYFESLGCFKPQPLYVQPSSFTTARRHFSIRDVSFELFCWKETLHIHIDYRERIPFFGTHYHIIPVFRKVNIRKILFSFLNQAKILITG